MRSRLDAGTRPTGGFKKHLHGDAHLNFNTLLSSLDSWENKNPHHGFLFSYWCHFSISGIYCLQSKSSSRIPSPLLIHFSLLFILLLLLIMKASIAKNILCKGRKNYKNFCNSCSWRPYLWSPRIVMFTWKRSTPRCTTSWNLRTWRVTDVASSCYSLQCFSYRPQLRSTWTQKHSHGTRMATRGWLAQEQQQREIHSYSF